MKLIVGLGNPEERYNGTRHNAGFLIVGSYAKEKGVALQPKDKFKALVGEFSAETEKVILALPTTYYNLSGEATRAIMDFYKLSSDDILVIHDELALPFGSIRARIGGSDAGNNGVKSITQHVGPDTARLRIGIYNELREKIDDADFVLSRFTSKEAETLPTLTQKAAELIDDFITGNFAHTTHS